MKRTLRMIAGVALLVTIGWGSYMHTRQEPDMTGWMLENVEALATDETPIDVFCWGLGCIDCPTTHRKVYAVDASYAFK